MRIGFDAKRFFLNDRGLGNYSRNLVYGLLKYYSTNSYHLYTPKYSSSHINTNIINTSTVSIHEPRGIGRLSKSAWRSLFLGSVSLEDNLTIFHGLSQELPRDIKKIKAKSIATIHDMIFLRYPKFYSMIDRRIYFNKVKFAVQNADQIIAISEQTKSDLINIFPSYEQKIKVIYQSCNEVFYEKRTKEELMRVKKHWHLPNDFLLFVGALNDNKNVLLILKALRLIKGVFDLPIIIIGRGDAYKKKLINYATKHKIRKQLIFASEISSPLPIEISSFYQLASAFIFPSFYEGFGIPILEARFSSTPVIASNSSCLEEAGGEDSNYFDPNDAEELASLLQNIENFKTTFPRKFIQKDITSQIVDLYKK